MVSTSESGIACKYFPDNPFLSRGFHNFESTAQLPRHRWYYLKEGFSASLVEEAIRHKAQEPGRKLNILEPFCGTGTTPLTTAMLGHCSTAIEVNPFLAFTARVKTSVTQWEESQFRIVLDRVIRTSLRGRHSHLEGVSTFTEGNGTEKWLFNKSVLRRYTSLVAAIDTWGDIYGDALKLSAVVAAYRCCNAKRDGKALRYKSDWRQLRYSGDDLISEFRNHVQIVLQDSMNHNIDPAFEPVIRTGDSRKELSELEDDTFDLVITSPPYLNSFDYSDIYRPELFLGKFVGNNNELRQIRLATVRSHIQVGWQKDVSFESSLLSPILNELAMSKDLWDERIPSMVHAYFDDLWRVFKAIKPKLRNRGSIWLVVSTSAYGGVHIPVDFIIADAANQAGFSLDGIYRLRHLRAAGQQWKRLGSTVPPLRESLIILSNA